MKTVLVVGGAGYIGSVLTAHLLSEGHKVVVLDNFSYGNNQCVLPYIGNKGYRFIYGDLSNTKVLGQAVHGVSDVVILAGLVGDPITKKYPELSHSVNNEGIKRLLTFCNRKSLHRVIFVSTCSNYGLIKENELADENFELNPLSLYAKSKVVAEKYILSMKGKVDFSPTILRFATAFGLSPRMRFDLTVSEFVLDLASGKELLVYDPDTWRPYCHVKDFARLISRVLVADNDTVSFEVFNAGGDLNNYTKKGIVELILAKLPKSLVRYQEHGSDPRNYRVNFSKVRERLDFVPEFSVVDGINELLAAIESKVFDGSNCSRLGNFEISTK